MAIGTTSPKVYISVPAVEAATYIPVIQAYICLCQHHPHSHYGTKLRAPRFCRARIMSISDIYCLQAPGSLILTQQDLEEGPSTLCSSRATAVSATVLASLMITEKVRGIVSIVSQSPKDMATRIEDPASLAPNPFASPQSLHIYTTTSMNCYNTHRHCCH